MFKLPWSARRLYATASSLSRIDAQALDTWLASPKQLVLRDTFSIERLSDLYITLPTRDGSRRPYSPPSLSTPLGYGAHLAFFHPRNAETDLRPDGTDSEFCPPNPFTRRMWAGGRITWDLRNPLLVGTSAVSTSTIDSVEKKGFEKGSPMVFVTQKITVTMDGSSAPSLVEERSHVYLAESLAANKVPRNVKDLPRTADFSFTYTPSLATLFRFSALTFNGHHIHLDKEYAQSEGYPERLVHGPLTALMLLEITMLQKPTAKFAHFEYRARNPIIVNRPQTIAGAWGPDGNSVTVWSVDNQGVVGMTGSIQLVSS